LDGKLVARAKSVLPFLANLDHLPTEFMPDDHGVLSDICRDMTVFSALHNRFVR
jgi:hypothetical protein